MLALAGWSLTACDESHNDYAQPTVFPQEEQITISGFEATPTAAASQNINLGTMAEQGIESIQLFTLTQGTLPAGVTLKNIRLEAWPSDLTEAVSTNVKATEDGYVTKEELANLVYTFYGKKSTERVFTAKLFANAFRGAEAQLITLGDFTLRITPEELENPYYYIYGNVVYATKDNAYKAVMTPDAESDVIFYYTSQYVSSGDIKIWNSKYWLEGNATSDFTKLYGSGEEKPNSYKGITGKLLQGSTYSIFSPTKEYYTFKIDLEALTYEWIKLEDQDPASYTAISITGLNGDWNTDIDMEGVDAVSFMKKQLKAKSHNWYAQITATSDCQVKFRADHDWATNWGFGSSDGEWTVNDEQWAKPCSNGAGNIALAPGKYNVYFCDITGVAHFVPVEE